MLSYNEQYNIFGGIFFVFNSKAKNKKRSFSINHKKEKRDSIKGRFPYKDYENWTKENFIIASLYVMFNYNPSSFNSGIELLRDLKEKDAMVFKNEIIYYRKYLQEDIENILKENTNPDFKYIKTKYRNKEIKWYTFYFFIVHVKIKEEDIEKSRIDYFLYRNVKNLLLYITFSEKSILSIENLIQDTIKI